MKKFTVLSLFGLLILAFSATSYAQAPKLEFKAAGMIDVQTFYGENVPQYNGAAGLYRVINGNLINNAVANLLAGPLATPTVGPNAAGWNKRDSHWESRAHLKFDAVMGPGLSGTIMFEIDSLRYGGVFDASNIIRGKDNFGVWTTDRTAVEVKNIYIDFGLPYFGIPVPMTVRAGAQTLGIRPGMLMVSDGAGVSAGIKIDPVLIAPFYAKALENLDFADDDADVWGLHANAKIGTFTVGGYGLLFRMNTYPFFVLQPNATLLGLVGTNIINQAPGTNKAHMWWFGAYADGKAGPVNLNFDFVYDYGSVDERLNLSGIPNVRYRGWASRLKVDYPWEKFNFGAVGMYATGANARHVSPTGLPGTPTNLGTNSKYAGGYVVPPGSEQGPANGESMVVYSMEPGATGGYGIAENANYAALSRGGFGGTAFAKLYGSVKATPWYKVTLQGLYIWDTTQNGNTFGNAVKYGNFFRNDTDIGWEFDLINEFQLYANLRFFAGFGYLFAGDALDLNTAASRNRSVANPWAFRTRLQYMW